MAEIVKARIVGDWRRVIGDEIVSHETSDIGDAGIHGTVTLSPVWERGGPQGVIADPGAHYSIHPVECRVRYGRLYDPTNTHPYEDVVVEIDGQPLVWEAKFNLAYRRRTGEKEVPLTIKAVTFDSSAMVAGQIALTGILPAAAIPDAYKAYFTNAALSANTASEARDVAVDAADTATGAAVQAVDAADVASAKADLAAGAVSLAEAEADRAIGLANAQDAHIAGTLVDPTSATHAAFKTVGNATYGGQGTASRMSSVSITSLSGEVEPVSMIRGRLYGRRGSDLFVSDDAAATWQPAGSAPVQLVRMLAADDGEVVAVTYNRIVKSSGWGSGSHTWVEKMQSHGAAFFLPWGFRGDGTVFITTEYAAGSGYPDSRYVRASFDAGSTWQVIYDAVAIHGETLANASHIHGCEYDPGNDRLYVCEGHGSIGGIWHSDDRGATWQRSPNMVSNPAPTSIIRTTNGLIAGSDSSDAGLLGVTFRANGMDEALVKTYNWRTGVPSVPGMGIGMAVDPWTGLVYCGFRVENANVRPTILGGTVQAGRMVFEWPELPVVPYDDILNIVIPARGVLLAVANVNGTKHLVRGLLAAPGATSESMEDSGNVLTGSSGHAHSVAVGPRSSTGSALRSVAVGVGSVVDATQDSTAIGYGATATNSTVTAIGSGATAGHALSTVVGFNATVRSATAVAIGANSGASGSAVAIGTAVQAYTQGTIVGVNASSPSGTTGATAFGNSAEATNQSTALGFQSKATAQYAVAVGYQATASHGRSVALGRATATTALDQIAVGARHFELEVLDANPANPASGKVRLYTSVVGGKHTVMARFPSGAAVQLGVEP